MLSVHGLHIFFRAHSFLWLYRDEAEAFLIRFHKTNRILIFNICAFRLTHIKNFFFFSPGIGKAPFIYLIFLISPHPLRIKNNGIDKVHHRVFPDLIQNIRYLSPCFFLRPCVYVSQRFLAEGDLIKSIFFQKIFFQYKLLIIPEPHGISYVQPGFFHIRKSIRPRFQVPVPPIHILVFPKNGKHLIQRIPPSAIRSYRHGCHDR